MKTHTHTYTSMSIPKQNPWGDLVKRWFIHNRLFDVCNLNCSNVKITISSFYVSPLTEFRTKICNSCHQFHQLFIRTFFVQIFCNSQNVTRKSSQNNVSAKNSYAKMLMKLTPGVYYINILQAAFSLESFFSQLFAANYSMTF